MKILLKLFAVLAVVIVVLGITAKVRYGGGEQFPDRTTAPLMSFDNVEVVANLDFPPGNIAISADNRIFFTMHPEAGPPVNLVEWRDGEAHPFPSTDYQPGGSEPLAMQEVLSVRIDRQQRLWLLDNATHGSGQPRLLAFDISSGELVHHYDFPKDIFGFGSHANDFQVSHDGNTIFISDASLLAKSPAIVVYDVQAKRSIRQLEGHVSVTTENYVPVVQGRKMSIGGIFSVKSGVNGIALDRTGEWLYYAPLMGNHLYRVPAAKLGDFSISAEALAQAVETHGERSMTDGMTTDSLGNVYLTDAENSAINRITPDKNMETVLKDARLRWPDGLGFGPDGYLYISCSSLQHVFGLPKESRVEHGPYQVFRFKPGADGVAGH